MFKRIAAFVVIWLGLTGLARAQDSVSAGHPARWDLQTCLDYATKNNIQLNLLRLNEKTAEQAYLLSKAARQPTLTGTIPLSYVSSLPGPVRFGPKNSDNAMFATENPIPMTISSTTGAQDPTGDASVC